MKYIVCEKPGILSLKDKEAPIRLENQALLKVNKVGICGTDLHAYSGNQAYFTYPKIYTTLILLLSNAVKSRLSLQW